jgi:hypothetical protein
MAEARPRPPFTEAIAWRVAIQLRHHYGVTVGTVFFRDGLIDVVPANPNSQARLEELLSYLRSMGYRAYVADGPDARLILTGEERSQL